MMKWKVRVEFGQYLGQLSHLSLVVCEALLGVASADSVHSRFNHAGSHDVSVFVDLRHALHEEFSEHVPIARCSSHLLHLKYRHHSATQRHEIVLEITIGEVIAFSLVRGWMGQGMEHSRPEGLSNELDK